jgi:S-adenosylmethionine-diacylglycerol 3-amino-3-carboxypropyl transferase
MIRSTNDLRTAVQVEDASTGRDVLQRLFSVWFDAFVYNQIWEDPRVDIEALRITPESRILTISSGGCNALNYLLESPASVTAVDLNRHHIHLLNLKIASIKHLPEFDDLFEFFGHGCGPRAGSNYLRYLVPALDKETEEFWSSNTLIGSLLYGDRITFFRDRGLYEHSRNGYFLRFFHRFAHLIGCRPEEIVNARTTEEQRALFKQHIDPFFENPVIRLIGKLPITLFGLGIPPQQFDELLRETEEGKSLIDLYRERVRKLACNFPTDDNYFAWQAFARKYDTVTRKAVPEYLKKENFELLRRNIDRITTRVRSATDEIALSEPGTYDRFVFLDAQDWMNVSSLTELWSAIVDRAAPGARIIFRTAGRHSPLESDLPPQLLLRFHYEKEFSLDLFARDRSSIYGGFHLYTLEK